MESWEAQHRVCTKMKSNRHTHGIEEFLMFFLSLEVNFLPLAGRQLTTFQPWPPDTSTL